ncbi:hypothetical protein PIIN_09842 [Serendipita indica DSM 11827]|uniref:F-box domain-containing protein n=1 Tax=Serendipita indica (strain DSM 11827) TaxID=1109443 RepID=G4U2K8_SERID|nr:hypothetical protein PIIN_09842 [Serendipita indica DSM 11827]
MDKLPYELVQEILDYIKHNRRTLIACSQLCKAWRHMLLPSLLQSATFRYKYLDKPAKPEPTITVKVIESRSWIRSRLSKLLTASPEAPMRGIGDAEQEIWNEVMRVLESSQETRLLIKKLHLVGVIGAAEHLETLADILARVPNVKELELSSWVWKSSGFGVKPLSFRAEAITTVTFRSINYSLMSQFEQHLSLFPCCVSINLHAVRWWMADVDRRVQPFPRTLKRLWAQGVNITTILERLLEVKPPLQLESVGLVPLLEQNIRAVNRLLTQVGRTLTHLSIGFQNIYRTEILRPDACVNLLSLSIVSVPWSQWGRPDKTWATTLLGRFAIARRLQSITIAYEPVTPVVVTSSMNTLDVDDMVARSFPRLQAFTLQKERSRIDNSFEELDNYFPKMFAKGILKGELLPRYSDL